MPPCKRPPNGAKTGSWVNFSSGDLYDSLPLFSLKGQGPAAGPTLSYNSLDPVAVPLGPGFRLEGRADADARRHWQRRTR